MNRIQFLKPTELYNIIQQRSRYPSVSDNNFLLILDARSAAEYAESHIITAKLAPRQDDGQWKVPYEAELECKEHIVVYDGHSRSRDASESEDELNAIQLAKFLVAQGSKNPIQIADGGYEDFSKLYPFLRTKKILYMPKELDVIVTYPTEIIPGQLYMGSVEQALNKRIQKDLKVRAHVAVTNENETYFATDSDKLCRVGIEDEVGSDLLSCLDAVCKFIDDRLENSDVVLIYSDLGISRNSAVALAYLVYKEKCTLREAWKAVLKCQKSTRPNRGFIKQLSQWEEKVLGERKTDIEDPAF
ncbi:serine/threonine/tyrosine-interacting-like protein 1 [Symsagittifera roscoffensis]|uniref:serine/threonine/tyrosine-interacting-like protein 1 n=1 Tax=Symsagittifera roscoffensis TaxID=84072 RepID=UPI00307B82F5